MGKILLSIVFSALCLVAEAQNPAPLDGPGKISGKVVDSVTGQPMDYATITVQAGKDGKIITGTTTDSLGRFSIPGLAPGTYAVSVEFIGYKKFLLNNVTVDRKQAAVQLKTVSLSANAGSLQGVVITARQKLIDNRIDKMVFNAEADVTSQSGAATDVLKKIPQVSVDPDGNVELAGTGGIRFLINGKPSTAFGSNVADVLQSIPAGQIKSIEVITNPGARYDAQGMGGIINIILKQTKVRGMNGNLSLTAGTRQENGSLNLSVRQGNLGVNAFVSGNARVPVDAPSSLERRSVNTAAGQTVLFGQNGVNRLNRHGLESGIGFDWTIQKKAVVSGNVGYNTFGGTSAGLVNQQQQTTSSSTGNVLSDILTRNNLSGSNDFHSIEASLGFKKTFSEDHELEISANTSAGKRNNRNNNFQSLLPQDSVYYGIHNVNVGRQTETQVSVDYTQPVKKDIIVGVGGRVTFVEIAGNADVYSLQPVAKNYLYDTAVSNKLAYHQKVYALYGEVALPVRDWFTAKAGIRYERTEIASFYSNAQHQASQPGYNTFVPSVYFSRKLGENQNLKISYSRRIERPDYGDLNPFVNTTDPKNITAGNPYLLPELGNRYELSYNLGFGAFGSFMATAFYRINLQDIQPYVKFYPTLRVGDSVFTNVSVGTRENIGTEKNLGLNLFADLHPAQKLGVRINGFAFRRHIFNAIDPGQNPVSFNYRTNVNLTYEFTKTLVSEFFGNFNSARNEVQGKYPSFTTYSFALRKQFWSKKGSLALVATNFFNRYVDQATLLYGTGFTTNGLRRIPFRSIGLNFTWRFGKLEFKKEKEVSQDVQTPEGQG